MKRRWSVIGLGLVGVATLLACAPPVAAQYRGGGRYGAGGYGGGYGAGRYGAYGWGGGGYAPGNYYYGRGYGWGAYGNGDYGYAYPDRYAYYDNLGAYQSF